MGTLAVGFAAGVYFLPILSAPASPGQVEVEAVHSTATFKGHFKRDLPGSDALHWGEGEVSFTPQAVAFSGKLAPGPAYKLYLSPTFVDTPADFERLKSSMALVGDIKTFDRFVLEVPPGIDPSKYTTAVIWCESFSKFITAAQYQYR